jgi:nucleoporin POM152
MPLDISLSTVGDHVYVLDEVADAVGNAVHMDMSLSSTDKDSVIKSKATRSFIILRRPTVAFKDCSLDTPTYLKLGSESSLVISGNTSDAFNAGWEVTLKYQPPIDAYRSGRRAAWLTPWERTFTNQGNRRDIHIPAIGPGDYTIVTMKGMV